MACRMIWQDLYAIQQEVDTLANVVAGTPGFSASADVGVKGTGAAGGVFNLLTTDHPDLKAPTSTVENEMATGKAQRNMVEYNQTVSQVPTVTLNMLANAYNLSLFSYLLFQSGASEAVGVTNTGLNVLKCIPYTTSDVTAFAYVLKVMSDNTDAVDQILKGAICSQLTLSGEEGGLITLSAEMMAAKWDQYDANAVLAAVKVFDDTPPLKFQDSTVKIGGTAVNAKSFSLQINNNPYFGWYNNNEAKTVCLGRLTATGAVAIPWSEPSAEGKNKQITDYISGVDKSFEIYWGAVTNADASTPKGGGSDTKNYAALKSNIRLTDYDVGGDAEVILNTQFAAVEDSSATFDTVSVYSGYDKTKLERIA